MNKNAFPLRIQENERARGKRIANEFGLSENRLYTELIHDGLLFFDTCYSGSTRGGDKTKMLVADSRAITIKPKIIPLPPGFMQFSAAGNDQLALKHPESIGLDSIDPSACKMILQAIS